MGEHDDSMRRPPRDSSDIRDDDTAVGVPGPIVLFLPEPGRCGGRLDPHQSTVPTWLADLVDWHVRPSASPWASARMARTICTHVDWAAVWSRDPQLFIRRAHVGAPPPPELWAAREALADHGYDLTFEVQFESIGDELALAIYGAGAVGRLTDQAWQSAAPLLTTCCSTIREPRPDALPDLLPPRIVTALSRRRLPTGLIPQGWQTGDWLHTWWSYPLADTLRSNCPCPAHPPPTSWRSTGQPP